MKTNLSSGYHALFRAAILAGFAVYIAVLVRNGHILYYLSPRMTDGVKWAAVGLYLITVLQVYRALSIIFGSPEACDCGHGHSHRGTGTGFKPAFVYVLFLVPLLLGFLLPDTALGSALAAKKGMNLGGAAPPQTAPAKAASTTPDTAAMSAAITNSADPLFPADKYKLPYAKLGRQLYGQADVTVRDDLFIETLQALQMYTDNFLGKKIELTGFVYRDDPAGSSQFIAGRFAVQCCTADASPYGVLVDYAKARTLKDDTWVKVTGTVAKTNYNGTELLTIKASSVEKIPAPKSGYVYPNETFGK